MAKHKIKANTYIVLVDTRRAWYCYRRQTSGRYRVGAKSAREAEAILRKRIGFGSVRTYYKTRPSDEPQLAYGEIVREFHHCGVKHATDPIQHYC